MTEWTLRKRSELIDHLEIILGLSLLGFGIGFFLPNAELVVEGSNVPSPLSLLFSTRLVFGFVASLAGGGLGLFVAVVVKFMFPYEVASEPPKPEDE